MSLPRPKAIAVLAAPLNPCLQHHRRFHPVVRGLAASFAAGMCGGSSGCRSTAIRPRLQPHDPLPIWPMSRAPEPADCTTVIALDGSAR